MSRVVFWAALLGAAALAGACSSAKYTVTDPTTGKAVQTVEARAPGGETFVMVVYYGRNMTPLVHAGGDSSELVNATAAAGARAVRLALKAVKP